MSALNSESLQRAAYSQPLPRHALSLRNSTTLHKTPYFRLTQKGDRYYLRCLDRHASPKGRRISKKDADYLLSLTNNVDSFSGACIELGVGVFQNQKIP